MTARIQHHLAPCASTHLVRKGFHPGHKALCGVTPPHFCSLFDGSRWPYNVVLLYVRFHVVFWLNTDRRAAFSCFYGTLNVSFLAAIRAPWGGVTPHCDQEKPILRTRRPTPDDETPTLGTSPWCRSSSLQACSTAPFWFRCWPPGHWSRLVLRPLGGLGAGYWIDPAPIRRFGALQVASFAPVRRHGADEVASIMMPIKIQHFLPLRFWNTNWQTNHAFNLMD